MDRMVRPTYQKLGDPYQGSFDSYEMPKQRYSPSTYEPASDLPKPTYPYGDKSPYPSSDKSPLAPEYSSEAIYPPLEIKKSPSMPLNEPFLRPNYQEAPPYSSYSEPLPSRPPPNWRTGYIAQFPLFGCSALVLALLAAIAALITLIVSDNASLESWKWQPSLVLAIASGSFKVMLAYALAQGALVFWWTRAVRGSTVGELHRVWEQSQHLWSALRAGKKMTFGAMATIVVTGCVIVGPLLQRASVVLNATTHADVYLLGHIAEELPQGYTASLSASLDAALGGVSLEFAQVVKEHDQNTPLVHDFSSCKGNCSATVQAAGVVATCGTPVVSDWAINRFSDNGGVPVFQINSSWGDDGSAALGYSREKIVLSIGMASSITTQSWQENLTVPTQNCTGQWTVTTCTLYQATVVYPITLTSNVLALNTSSPTLAQVGDVPKYGFLNDGSANSSTGGQTSTLGGLALYLSSSAAANVTLSQLGLNRYPAPANFPSNTAMSNYSLNNFDPFPAQFFTSDAVTRDQCAYTWSNPTTEILHRLNALMFRTALRAGIANPNGFTTGYEEGIISAPTTNSSTHITLQSLSATSTSVSTIYKTSWGFCIAAMVVMFLGILSVIPMYAGYWRLGFPGHGLREGLSFNPIRMGMAFDALALEGVGVKDGRQVVFVEISDRGGERRWGFEAPGRIRRSPGGSVSGR